jgi:porphobilinogen deaminase
LKKLDDGDYDALVLAVAGLMTITVSYLSVFKA